MIEKERLEELINKCATVYMARAYTKGIYLMPENFEVNDKELVFKYKIYAVPLEDLFETEEEAKWFAEFGCIERTERLELPTWEELNCMNFKRFDFLSKYNGYITIWIDIFDNLTITNNDTYQEMFKATKENYYKVCRKAKELFLGQSNNS